MAIESINPASGEIIARYNPLSDSEIDQKLELAQKAFREHRKTTFVERAEALCRAADILERESEQFGALMTAEMGKTLSSAIAEAKKSALGCRYYAEHAERHLADEVI